MGPLLAAIAALGGAATVEASGPFFPQAEFERSYDADGPAAAFLAGDLGVLVPPVDRWRLFGAYRHLAGAPLSPVESRALLDRLETRLARRDSIWVIADAAVREWLAARVSAVGGGAAPSIRAFRSLPKFAFYPNGLPDAFRRAADTRRRRVTTAGASQPAVREWVDAQDMVFANCDGKAPVIPPELPADRPAAARADRAYQIAAAQFYAERFDDAARSFRAIAADADSEWRGLGAYLATRVEIRRATLAPSPEAYARAEQAVRELLARPDLGTLRPSAEGLAAFLRARAHPVARTAELARALSRPRTDDAVRQDLADYLDLLGAAARGDGQDMSEWIAAFGRAGTDAVRRWRAGGGLPWLVAALAVTPPSDPVAPDLLREAAQVPAGSPAEATVRFHQVRLLAGTGRLDEARALAASVAGASGRLGDPGTRNLFLAWRFALARSLDELIETAPRRVVAVSLGEGAWYWPARDVPQMSLFDADAGRTMSERLPLAALAAIARDARLSEPLRLHVAQAAWTRAALLRDEAAALAVIDAMPASIPASLAADLAAYRTADAGAARVFAASFAILRWPGLRPYVVGGLSRLSAPLPDLPAPTGLDGIDDFRQNWWCQPRPGSTDTGSPVWVHDYYGVGVTPRGGLALVDAGPPAFLADAERRAAASQWTAIRTLPTAPNYLVAQVLAWVRAHPRDPRAAESLALAVRATRYGCVDGDTSALSRAAFQLLHARYPTTPWARQTKYWY